MCRICGRTIKCIFDSMPSRAPISSNKRTFTTAVRNPQSKLKSSRQLLRPTLNIQSSSPTLPPTFLPHRSKLHQIATMQQEPTPTPQFRNTQPLVPSQLFDTVPSADPSSTTSPTNLSSTPPPPPSKPLVISKSLQTLLPALQSQPPHYITTHIHRFPYTLTKGDTLRLPFHLHGVSPGDVLRFNRASLLGSRDYTLKAGTAHSEAYDKKATNEPNYLDDRLYECRLRVVGVEAQPMVIKEKKKRRNRRIKRVLSKHKYTVLRVMEVRVRSLEELIDSDEIVLLE